MRAHPSHPGGRVKRACIPSCSLLVLAVLTACGASTDSAGGDRAATASTLTVTRAWSRAAPDGAEDAAVYFDAVSSVTEEIAGATVTSDLADRAELHETESMDHSAMDSMDHTAMGDSGQHDMMSMGMVGTVALPANEIVHFSPGGNHVMLRGVRKTLRVGDQFPLTLQLRGGGPVSVIVTVSEEAPQPT